MRIVQIGKYYAPVAGGIERVTRDLAESWKAAGNEVLTLVSHSKNQLSTELTLGGVLLRQPRWGNLLGHPIVNWNFDCIESFEPDLVVVHLPHLLPLASLSRIKVRKIGIYHADPSGFFKEKLHSWIFKRYQSLFDRIVLSSHRLVEFKGLIDFPREQISVVPFGIQDPFHDQVLDENLTFEKIKNKLLKPEILFVGRLVKYKNLEILIAAMKKVAGVLNIIGDGPERNHLQKFASKQGVSEKVIFCGNLSDNDVHQYYLKSSLFVLPSISRSETFGLALLEALAHGVPAISFALNTGVNDVNVHGQTGLVLPLSAQQDLGREMQGLLAQPERIKLFSRRARQHFLRHFKREKMEQDFQLIFTQKNRENPQNFRNLIQEDSNKSGSISGTFWQ